MRTQEYVYKHKAKPEEYLSVLAKNISYIMFLNTHEKVYNLLAEWFINNESRLTDDEIELPSIVEIAKEFGTDNQRISKWLISIYDDILELNQTNPEKFLSIGQILCELNFHSMGAFVKFNVGLYILPRKGDFFSFDFIYPKIGRWGYYIDNFYHSVENGKQMVHINLDDKDQEHLLYYQLMKEKAYLNGRITLEEFSGLNLSKKARKITYQEIR